MQHRILGFQKSESQRMMGAAIVSEECSMHHCVVSRMQHPPLYGKHGAAPTTVWLIYS